MRHYTGQYKCPFCGKGIIESYRMEYSSNDRYSYIPSTTSAVPMPPMPAHRATATDLRLVHSTVRDATDCREIMLTLTYRDTQKIWKAIQKDPSLVPEILTALELVGANDDA